MLAADPSLEEQLGKIGSGAFLKSDGGLKKKLTYETLHSLPADAGIAQMLANGAGSSGGVCGYVRSIQSDLSDAGSGAPNTRSRCLDTWDDAAVFAIAVRSDYITFACLPALRVSLCGLSSQGGSGGAACRLPLLQSHSRCLREQLVRVHLVQVKNLLELLRKCRRESRLL